MSYATHVKSSLEPAREPPKARDRGQLLIIDGPRRSFHDRLVADLPAVLRPGDLLVLNDAATLPASLRAQANGQAVELRLVAQLSESLFQGVLFGAGDWTIATERRAAPPSLDVGDGLELPGLLGRIAARSPLSPRLVDIEFDRSGDALLHAIYTAGQSVQYSYQRSALALWSVQASYAGRPWAFEMPSAGRPLSFRMLGALRRRGIELATLTHAAGLSSTGDPVLDRLLPLPERYDIPLRTVAHLRAARARHARVIAVGTSVVRALEASVSERGDLSAGAGTTDLRIGPDSRLRVFDGLLSGVHVPGESHYELLRAFAADRLLRRALAHAAEARYHAHEFGDSTLLFAEER